MMRPSICNACRAQKLRAVSPLVRPQPGLFLSMATASRLQSTRTPPGMPACLHRTPRFFSTTTPIRYKTVEEAKSKYRLGPFSWQAGLLFFTAGVSLTLYFRHEKSRMSRVRIAEHSKGVGRPLVGGEFSLTDHFGRRFTHENLKGKYSLVYFGFTNCPDICPEELDKMSGMIEQVKERHGEVMRSVFITCDPARDTPEILKEYLKEFHGDILGLTGTYEAIKSVCKAYRVYFSTPSDVEPGQDYLVDHSIYFYLMGMLGERHEIVTDKTDPDGDFVEAIGRNFTVNAAAKVINDHIADWRGKIDRG